MLKKHGRFFERDTSTSTTGINLKNRTDLVRFLLSFCTQIFFNFTRTAYFSDEKTEVGNDIFSIKKLYVKYVFNNSELSWNFCLQVNFRIFIP